MNNSSSKKEKNDLLRQLSDSRKKCEGLELDLLLAKRDIEVLRSNRGELENRLKESSAPNVTNVREPMRDRTNTHTLGTVRSTTASVRPSSGMSGRYSYEAFPIVGAGGGSNASVTTKKAEGAVPHHK